MKVTYDEKGLVPAIIQNAKTLEVLMLGYMNEEALKQTLKSKRVTFYSRSKKRLWVKGESSGNFLNLVGINNDCDSDALLVLANPEGPTCHKGSSNCWDVDVPIQAYLENMIQERMNEPKEGSYVSSLFEKGMNKIAQKVGEEAVEVVIEAKDENASLFLNESADLFFHFLILVKAKGFEMNDVYEILESRRKS